jgi:plasmid stability protein
MISKQSRYNAMADVLIRNIDKETLNRLKERAASNNRSLQEELKELVEFHAKPGIEATRDRVNEILVKYKASGKDFPDSGDELSEDRNR